MARDRALEDQGPDGVDRCRERRRVVHGEHERLQVLGPRLEPDGQLRDDPEVRLDEEAVEGRTDADPRKPRRRRVRESTEAGSDDVAGGQHHLEPAHVGGAIAVRARALAALERVADEAPVGPEPSPRSSALPTRLPSGGPPVTAAKRRDFRSRRKSCTRWNVTPG